MDLDSKAVMRFRVFIAQENFDTVSKTASKHRQACLQDASYFQHALKFQRHDRILVPLDNICYDFPVGVNERTGEVGNLCLDLVTPAEAIQQFRIHGVFKEYGSTKPMKINRQSSNFNEFPPRILYNEPQWQYHYGDPFLLRPEFNTTSSSERNNDGVRKINVFNLRTGEPLSVPLSKVRLHPNYRFKSSEIRGSKRGLESSSTQFRGGQLLTVAVLGGRNVRLGGRATSSLLFCLATASGIPSWVLEDQLEPLDKDFMSVANHTCDWLVSDMDDEIQEDIHNLGLRDLSLRIMYAGFQSSLGGQGDTWEDYPEGYREEDFEQEDAQGEDYSEDGDIHSRGMLSPTPSYHSRDRDNSGRRRWDAAVRVQRTRQSSTGSEVQERRRAHIDPLGGGVQVDSTPVQSDNTDQRGRNPIARTARHVPLPESQPSRTRGQRLTCLAPPPDHFQFLEARLTEERERFNGVDFARYSSQEREPQDGGSERGESGSRGPLDMYEEALAYMSTMSRGPEQMGRGGSGSEYQPNYPRRSPPIGDGY
ncbi:hypothetical protein TWF730_007948 [Orbilia blumenaviensis]|uniref:Uncharacterized protein n=1 Tax=Orbilia blumenaviensis TaxID=1796055 RepID=A0AAV9VC90_9PEZI